MLDQLKPRVMQGRQGYLTMDAIKAAYDARCHPAVMEKKLTEDEVGSFYLSSEPKTAFFPISGLLISAAVALLSSSFGRTVG
jgi:hypothetical protein